jgi:ATP-dependent RNA helicase DeaD
MASHHYKAEWIKEKIDLMKNFEALGINGPLLQAIEALGFTEPTPVQAKAIPLLLQGTTDIVALAQTGTGKTAAFGLPLLQLVNENEKLPQALVICPTRELCMQISNDLENFKKFLPKLHTVAVYGGASIGLQIKDIKRGVHIVIATPGRLIDLIERKAINLEKIKYLVLDEADEMLNMGFRGDIEFVMGNTPKRDSVWLFSATMPNEVRQVSKKYMKTPVEITMGKKNMGAANIDHQYYITSSQHRYETLKRIIDFNPGMYGIIFTRTKLDAQEIAEKLLRQGYDIEALHGDLTQAQRDMVMGRFRDKSLQLLIATDVAARGIDVDGVTHVINYALPDDIEVYTHRSGRTARAGKSGICLSIVHSKETFRIKQIEKIVGSPFHRLDIPQGVDVCRKQFFHFIDKLLVADVSHGAYETYLPALEEKFAGMSKEEVLKRIASLEFDRFLQYYQYAEDLNAKQAMGNSRRGDDPRRERMEKSDNRERNYSGDFQKLFINLGTKDGFYKASFLQFILDLSGLRKDVLGRVDMKSMNTFVEVDKKSAKKMIEAIDGKKFQGRRIRMNEA